MPITIQDPQEAKQIIEWFAGMGDDQLAATIGEYECLEAKAVPILGACFKGQPPESVDVQQGTFDTFCMKMAQHGAFDLEGCAETKRLLRAEELPPCLKPEHYEILEYCDASPHAEPDLLKEGMCWLMRLAPEVGEDVRQAPPCPSDQPAPSDSPSRTAPSDRKRDPAASPPPADDNRMLWIIGGVAALAVLGGGAYYLSRRR